MNLQAGLTRGLCGAEDSGPRDSPPDGRQAPMWRQGVNPSRTSVAKSLHFPEPQFPHP